MRQTTARGRADAKAKGVRFGRKPKLTPHQQREAIRRRDVEGETLRSIARSYNVSPQTISRLKAAGFGAKRRMANDKHLSTLMQGSVVWNKWYRRNHPDVRADLSGADLRAEDLSGADLRGANLSGADLGASDLSRANLSRAVLTGANLTDANLSEAKLSEGDLNRADLTGADLTGANLSRAYLAEADLTAAKLSEANLGETALGFTNFSRAILRRANLSQALLHETIFANIDLSDTDGLDECLHVGPSIIDFRTLSVSENLPLPFLRGCGLPDHLIEYIPSLRGLAFQFYSCFISYSSKDKTFAQRLHADLQNAGVRCWFAPHDLPIGAKTWDSIDEAIRVRDKLLVILSEASIGSDWVEAEINKAYAEERDRRATVLFPVRIDDVVMTTPEPWASRLRNERNIGDFRRWRSVARYSKSLERLLRDLKATIVK